MFAGCLSFEQPLSAWGDPTRILAALAPYSQNAPRDVWVSSRQMLLQVATRNDASSAVIFSHMASGVAVAFWGRLDNRSDLIHRLEAQPNVSDDELIALAWLKWGENCPENLIGDFAFAIVSQKTGTVFLVRDVMGVKPLYYRTDNHGMFFANSVSAFKPLELATLTRRQKWVAEYMLELSFSHEETAYEGILKLPAAHCISMYSDGRMNLRRYHQFNDDSPVERTRNPKWLEAYKAAWQEAIACRIPKTGMIGTENSGGLDSGSITAEIARQLTSDLDRLHGMAYCFDELEPEYIMATAMQWQMKNTFLFAHDSSRDWPAIRAREIQVQGYPMEHAVGVFHYPFYELCQTRKIATLFSGFGGDEAVTYPGHMPSRIELLDQGNLRGLWRACPGSLPMRLSRMAKTVFQAQNLPQRHPHFMKYWSARWPYQMLNSRTVQKYDLENAFFASATYDERFRRINDASLYLLSRSYTSTRLENCSLMAASYGVDYVWPLLDQRLVQQWLSTPSIWKVGDGGVGRYIHRRAVAGVCVDKVVSKDSKDMGASVRIAPSTNMTGSVAKIQFTEMLATIPDEIKEVVDVSKIQSMIDEYQQNSASDNVIHDAIATNFGILSNTLYWLASESQKKVS